MMASQPIQMLPVVGGDADGDAAAHECIPLVKKGKIPNSLPAEPELLRMLQKMRGKNGVAAKILAKRSPNARGLQWKADHSTFSALNLESRNGAIQQPAKSMLRAPTQVSKPIRDQVGVLKSELKSVGICKTDTTPIRSTSTEATVTDLDVDSLLSTGDSADIEDSTASFTEFRRFALQLRGSVGLSIIPCELETLRTAEKPEQRASSSMHAASFTRTVSAESASTQFTHDAHGAPISRQQSASTTTTRKELLLLPTSFSRNITGDSLSSGFGHGFARATTEPMAPGTWFRSVTSESISTPFARAHTVSCDPLDELRRRVQSLLNKVCPENMSRIADKIAMINVMSADELEVIIELIFRKALAEPHYCETYADLIFSLHSAFPEFPSEDGGKNITFKSSILNICQNEFEALPSLLEKTEEDREKAAGDDEGIEFARKKMKDRMLANMKLIGHIFLRQLLPARVISSVIQDLVLGNEENHIPEEHNIECACELLMSTGHTLESVVSRSVQLVCGRLAELRGQKTANGKDLLSKRIQFLVQDVFDARLAGWTKKSFKTSAKTKEEVRLDQQRELKAKMLGEASPTAEQVIAGQRPNYVTAGHSA